MLLLSKSQSYDVTVPAVLFGVAVAVSVTVSPGATDVGVALSVTAIVGAGASATVRPPASLAVRYPNILQNTDGSATGRTKE